VRINDVTHVGVLSMSATPVFRAQDRTRVFASALVEHVSCLHVAKASEVFYLKSLAAERPVEAPSAVESLVGVGMAAAAAKPVLAGVDLERGRASVLGPVQGFGAQLQRQAKDELSSTDGTSGFNGDVPSTTGANGTTSTNGTNPIDPWDLRTSSPPG
jgi:hypothetical protein